MNRRVFLCILLISGVSAAETVSDAHHTLTEARSEAKRLKLCAAIRGNGNYIFTHFASLARLTEAYGPFDGLAGGSSASITSFFYESIVLNPAVQTCSQVTLAQRACSEREKSLRIAFLLKSIEEYLEVIKETPEALAIEGMAQLGLAIKLNGIEALMEKGQLAEAKRALKLILQSKQWIGMINPQIFEMIEAGRVKEVMDQVKNFGKFSADDPSIFIRPGLLNFNEFPRVLGKIADFYAGRGPSDQNRLRLLLEKCATESLSEGNLWGKIQKLNPWCVTSFHQMIQDYREKYDGTLPFRHRVDDAIGGKIPTLISTSIVQGQDLVEQFLDSQKKYLSDAEYKVEFNVPFARVDFGYWGRPMDLIEIDKKLDRRDLKSQKFVPMGPADSAKPDWTPWSEALRTSPAEPGLSAIQQIDSTRLSAGGWSDLHPVAALKAMNCENVIYITRQDPESEFAVKVARLFGMSREEEDSLYKLGDQPNGVVSSFQKSLNEAEGIWCTNWDHFAASDIKGMMRNSYRSSLITQAPFLLSPIGQKRPIKFKDHSDAIGCSVTR